MTFVSLYFQYTFDDALREQRCGNIVIGSTILVLWVCYLRELLSFIHCGTQLKLSYIFISYARSKYFVWFTLCAWIELYMHKENLEKLSINTEVISYFVIIYDIVLCDYIFVISTFTQTLDCLSTFKTLNILP